MLIGYFTERPYQDAQTGFFGATGLDLTDLDASNDNYDARVGSNLYHRYLDEKLYAEEQGFDALMLNEHHSTPFCMGSVMNVEAAILARITRKAKIVLLGNILPIWEDPLWLAETLAQIDMISGGRLVTGWVRGGGRESVSHNAQAPFNWERFQEAHDFVVKAWSTAGPFRWEGEHYNFRYVNPWSRPLQDPHPQIWIPGIMSRNTVKWTAEHRYPYIMLATDLEPTKQSFEYYDEVARENGYEAGSEHHGYLFKVHVDETEELAEEAGRRYLQGPQQPVPRGQPGSGAGQSAESARPDQPHERVADDPELRRRRIARAHRRSGGGAGSARGAAAGGGRHLRQLRGSEAADDDHHGHAEDGDSEDSSRARIPAAGPNLLLGWRRGDDARGFDALAAAVRGRGDPATREIAKELDLKSAFEKDTRTGADLAATAS